MSDAAKVRPRRLGGPSVEADARRSPPPCSDSYSLPSASVTALDGSPSSGEESELVPAKDAALAPAEASDEWRGSSQDVEEVFVQVALRIFVRGLLPLATGAAELGETVLQPGRLEYAKVSALKMPTTKTARNTMSAITRKAATSACTGFGTPVSQTSPGGCTSGPSHFVKQRQNVVSA
mmetsp:Transcript_23580/g.60234  ORF Transcript_23580/g.60234 Transcript_23580/m.60234 type:complete len:179 (+) Transcript_23580:504-1040(+)